MAFDGKVDGVFLLGDDVRVPSDFDEAAFDAFPVDVRTILPVDLDTLSCRYEADDVVSGNRVAAACQASHDGIAVFQDDGILGVLLDGPGIDLLLELLVCHLAGIVESAGFDDLACQDGILVDHVEEVVDAVAMEGEKDLLGDDLHGVGIDLSFPEAVDESLSSLLDLIFADIVGILLDEIFADLGLGEVRLGDVQPFRIRMGFLVGEDFDDVSCLQGGREGNKDSVYLGSLDVFADIRMDAVAKIQWGRTVRKADDVSLGCEDIDVGIEDVMGEGIDIFLGGRGRVLVGDGDEILEPMELVFDFFLFDLGIVLAVFLVSPVGSDTAFGDLIHLLGANLDFKDMPGVADDGRVKRLVHVGLGHGDVVLEPARDGLEVGMDITEDGIAVLLRVGDDPQCHQVIDLVEGVMLVMHLLVDRVDALDPVGDGKGNLGRLQDLHKFVLGLGESLVGVVFRRMDLCFDLLVVFSVDIPQGEVFHFGLNLIKTKPVGYRDIDVECLLGDADLLCLRLELEGSHVMKPVGQLDDDDTDILGHGNENLAVVFRREFDVLVIRKTGDLGQSLDQVGNFVSEFPLDVGLGGVGVFDGVMKETGTDGLRAALKFGDDHRHADAVGDVGIARLPDLSFMFLFGISVGLLDQGEVIRVVDIPAIDVLDVFKGIDFVLNLHFSL